MKKGAVAETWPPLYAMLLYLGWIKENFNGSINHPLSESLYESLDRTYKELRWELEQLARQNPEVYEEYKKKVSLLDDLVILKRPISQGS